MEDSPDADLMNKKMEEHKTNLAHLRQWTKEQINIPQDIKDEEILMFLHSCYYNVARCERTLSSYYSMRAGVPELFSGRNFTCGNMRTVQDVVKFCFLPNRTSKGWAVLLGKLHNHDASQLHLESVIKLLFMHIDSFLLTQPLVPGMIFLFDMKGTTLSHLTRINISLIRKFLSYVQEAMPLRLREIRIINVTSVISHIMKLIKPFIHKNHLQYIKLHTPGNIGDMYEKIPREFLPKDYDGEQASFLSLNKLAISQLNECLSVFAQEETLLSVLNKSKTKTSTASVASSFKKLDLD